MTKTANIKRSAAPCYFDGESLISNAHLIQPRAILITAQMLRPLPVIFMHQTVNTHKFGHLRIDKAKQSGRKTQNKEESVVKV